MNELIESLKQKQKKLYLEFGGQGAPYLKELSKLFLGNPELGQFFQSTFAVLKKHENLINSSKVFSEGFALEKWLEEPDSAPVETYLMRANVSIPAIMVAHSANYLLFNLNGYPLTEMQPLIGGATGHSQGIVAAVMASIALKSGDFYSVYEKFLEYQLLLGLRAQESYLAYEISASENAESVSLGDKNPAPMVAVIGYSADEISRMAEEVNLDLSEKEKIYLALFNTPESTVISAPVKSLLAFRKKFKTAMDEKKSKFVYLRTTAPFHSPHMKGCEAPFYKDLEEIHFNYKASDLSFPAYSFFDGRDFRTSNDLGKEMFAEVALKSLFWQKAVANITTADAGMIIDFGPSKTIQSLTQSYIAENNNLTIYCISNPKDAKVIFG